MIVSLWCVICGLDFEPVGVHDPDEIDWDDSDSENPAWWADSFLDSKIIAAEQVQWMSDLNVIGPKNKYPFFSTAENPFSGLIHPAIKQVHVARQEPTAKIPGHVNPQSQDGDFELFLDLFPLHGACSKILQKTLSRRLGQPEDKDMPTTLTQVHRTLNGRVGRCRDPSYACWSGPDSANLGLTMGMSWYHGYFGVEQFWGDSFEIEPNEGWEYLCADPIGITTPITLLPLTFTLLKLLEPLRQLPVREPTPSSQDIPIAKLPNELLSKINSHLSTASIISLHRTCHSLARRIPLTQHFWRDQLITGKLVPYIWPGDMDIAVCVQYDKPFMAAVGVQEKETCVWDWRGLCRLLMKKHYVPGRDEKDNDEVKLEALPLGFRNRRRIYAVAKEIGKESEILSSPPKSQ